MKLDNCFYCENKAEYFDIVTDNGQYLVSDVCKNHFTMDLIS